MGGQEMTKRKEHTWEPNNKANGVPMGNTGALPHIPVISPLPEEEVALATRYVRGHCDQDDAPEILAMLGLPS